MAEAVNRILESLLPHLEELLQSGIFNEKEIRIIVQKRRQLEHRLFANPPRLQDFLQAIEYELNLDQFRKVRKETLGVISSRSDGEFGIANRIHGLFRRALKHFKGDVKLWYQYVHFCQERNQENELCRVYGRALAVHPTESALWIMAAKFEFDSRRDAAAARSVFQQSIKANPNNQHLWTEYFRMELLFVEKLAKRRETLGLDPEDDKMVNDELLKCKLAEIVFNHSIKSIPDDVQFRLKLVEVCSLFDETNDLQDIIYGSMKRDFNDSALCWDALAKRCWRAVSTDHITHTQQIYKDGLESIQDDNERKALWRLYCQWLLDHTHPEVNRLENLVLSSCKQMLVTEQSSILIFNRMLQYGQVESVLSLLDSVLESLSTHSCQLWKLKLQLSQSSMSNKEWYGLCGRAVKIMNTTEEKLILYQYWIDMMLVQQEDISSLLEEALCDTQHKAIMERMMEWHYTNEGIKAVRKLFKRFRPHSPLPCIVYLRYIQLELLEGTSPKKGIVDEGLTVHGETSADIWLECIRAQLRKSAYESVQTLHWRAVNTIKNSHLLDKFTQCYNDLVSF